MVLDVAAGKYLVSFSKYDFLNFFFKTHFVMYICNFVCVLFHCLNCLLVGCCRFGRGASSSSEASGLSLKISVDKYAFPVVYALKMIFCN